MWLVSAALVAACGLLAAADTPPRGWNSYDSFNWVVTESDFRAQAKLVAEKLLPFGYDTVTVDYLWAQGFEGWNATTPPKLRLDEIGRWQPNLDRWPSATGSSGFTDVANYVHSLGLKFGVHIMRGIAVEAVEMNAEIPGSGGARTGSIGDMSRSCPWYTPMVAVNVSAPGGQEWMDENYKQLREWGVDFVKNDCTFGQNFAEDNIRSVSLSMDRAGGDWVYSLSPGTVRPQSAAEAKSILEHVTMYRAAGDDWDSRSDLFHHFAAANLFQPLIGVPGRDGKPSFPDLDMLPLGRIAQPCGDRVDTPKCRPNHDTDLTPGQQRMQLTLWSVARSPLFFGGDMTALDNFTLGLLTNKAVLDVNARSSRNRCILSCSTVSGPSGPAAWAAELPPAAPEAGPTLVAALFNGGSAAADVSVPASDINIPSGARCQWTNAWDGSTGSVAGGSSLSVRIAGNDAAMLTIVCPPPRA